MTARAVVSSATGDYDQTVAAKLRGCLAEKRISKHQLAERLGQTDFWVGRRANGQTPITVGELLLIAEALDEPIERFLPPRAELSRSVSAYGSEGWEFESLRARPSRHPRRRRADNPRRHLRLVPAIYAEAVTA